MPSIVDISHLDFGYGPQLVLKHIHLQIEAGSTLGLIGPNGGGKTTLMRLMLGLNKPTQGSITIGGMSPRQAVAAGNVVGYLPQKAHFPANFPLSVRQAVRLGLAGKTGMLRGYAKDDLAFVEGLMERIGLEEVADQPIGQLSGGQAQRAFIARALAARPRLLLLDEPTVGIDRSGQQKFIEQVVKLKEELGLAVVFCSHDLRAVSSISDRIACLNLTLHYHDVPHRMPEKLAYEMFACDLEAMGVMPGVEPTCGGCDHEHAPITPNGAASTLE